MSYRILWTGRAERDLKKLDRQVRERILDAVDSLRTNPRRGAKKLKGVEGLWRIRVGDWRVIYSVDDTAKEVIIHRIRHRGGAY